MISKFLSKKSELTIENATISLEDVFDIPDSNFSYFDFSGIPKNSKESYWLMLYRDLEEDELTVMSNPAKDQNNINPGDFHISLRRNSLKLTLPRSVWKTHWDYYQEYNIGFNVSDEIFENIITVLRTISENQGSLEIEYT